MLLMCKLNLKLLVTNEKNHFRINYSIVYGVVFCFISNQLHRFFFCFTLQLAKNAHTKNNNKSKCETVSKPSKKLPNVGLLQPQG